MRMRQLLSLCGVLGSLGMVSLTVASPAMAGCDLATENCWWRAHHALSHMENRIAYLEANPNIDDSDKGPRIDAMRHKILRVRAAIGERWPHWPTPCCYSRRPLYIR